MKIEWITPLLLIQSYRTIGSPIQDEYNQYSFYQKRPLSPRPLDAMADLTNDLGISVLRVIAAGGAVGNVAFSPFGLMAVSVLLYEGSSGYSALQIKQALNLPWEVLAVRIGVRDLNRYLKTYFKSDGFLNGLTMSREEVCLRPQFKRVLQLYGFDDTNSFLIDSCPETAATTMYPLNPMSVTTHGTVVTEITPTSQIIQVSTNFTNGSASEISTVSTELPAKVTYMGDASFTISNVDTNTNLPMNSQTDTMVVNIETQPHIIPIESSTNQMETSSWSPNSSLMNDQESIPSNEIGITNTKLEEPVVVTQGTLFTTVSTTEITSEDPMLAAATIMQTSTGYSPDIDIRIIPLSPQIDESVDTTINNSELHTTVETSTTQLYTSTTRVDGETILSSESLYITPSKNRPDVTTDGYAEESTSITISTDIGSSIPNEKYVLTKNQTETTTPVVPTTTTNMDVMTTTINNSELHTTVETSTIQLYTSTTRVDGETILSSESSYITPSKNQPDVTTDGYAEESTSKTISTDIGSSIPNETYVLTKNQTETTTPVVPTTTTNMDVMTTTINNSELHTTVETNMDIDTETILSTKPTSNNDDTTEPTTLKSNTIIFPNNQTTSFTKSELNDIDDMTTVISEDLEISTTTNEVSSTIVNLSNTTEIEIMKGAESNRHYQIVPLELKKSARYMQESNDNLPTFNVEFVVSKEDLRTDCNGTKKKTAIKPDRILTEYPKNSGVSITLREAKKRKRRHYQIYNENGYQRFNGYKTYGHPSGWMDRASDPFESNLFNSGYRRIPFFTYTAVLPFGFIYELKSQVIEIPLDDPKYTLMILMPTQSNGLSELLLLLPTLSLRNIHNSLKPTAVHATIPTFKYTAKVDLTSALQQIGIHDVFYRYRADLSFMSPDARLYVNSIQQVVSVTAKKYNTSPVYEIQRKYVERDFVVSRPFVYFVLDIHTKVSLIAGVITDPLAAPIWV